MVVRLLSRSALRRQAGSEIVVAVLVETRHRGADLLQVLCAFLKLRSVVRVAFWRQRGLISVNTKPPRTRIELFRFRLRPIGVFKVRGALV